MSILAPLLALLPKTKRIEDKIDALKTQAANDLANLRAHIDWNRGTVTDQATAYYNGLFQHTLNIRDQIQNQIYNKSAIRSGSYGLVGAINGNGSNNGQVFVDITINQLSDYKKAQVIISASSSWTTGTYAPWNHAHWEFISPTVLRVYRIALNSSGPFTYQVIEYF